MSIWLGIEIRKKCVSERVTDSVKFKVQILTNIEVHNSTIPEGTGDAAKCSRDLEV